MKIKELVTKRKDYMKVLFSQGQTEHDTGATSYIMGC